jgi:hypothetical protein
MRMAIVSALSRAGATVTSAFTGSHYALRRSRQCLANVRANLSDQELMSMVSLLLSILLAIDQPARSAASPQVSIAGELLADFNAGRFDAASKFFSESMRAAVTPAYLAEVKRESDAHFGNFLYIRKVLQRIEGGLPVVELVCKYRKATVSFRVVFDLENHVGSVSLGPAGIAPVDAVLEAGAREFLKNLFAGNFEVAGKQFDPKMREHLPPAALARLQAQITSQHGAFRIVTAVNQMTDQDNRTIDLTAAFERTAVSIRVTFDSGGQLSGLKITPLTSRTN